eukprot:scaffold93534_cov69-Phaeocystis_antarctica.AAC.2
MRSISSGTGATDIGGQAANRRGGKQIDFSVDEKTTKRLLGSSVTLLRGYIPYRSRSSERAIVQGCNPL